MKNTLKHHKKTRILASAILLFFMMGFAILMAEDNQPVSVPLSTVAEELAALWPEKGCAHYVTRYSGEPLISLACKGDYTSRERQQFLDDIFKKGFILKEQTEKLSPRSGFYLYKTEYPLGSGKLVFIKLYFRDAVFLWPKTPFNDGSVAVFVEDVYRLKDLVKWQSLGVPLSYGVVPHKRETREVSEKIRTYKQAELWMSLSLEPVKMSPLRGKILRVGDAMDPEKLKTFLDESFAEVGEVKGVNNRMGSLFTKNVYAMRRLVAALKEREVDYFLDTQTTRSSVAYETAQIMSMHAFKRDYILDHHTNLQYLQKNWAYTMKALKDKGWAIVIVHAGNWRSYEFIKEMIRKKRINKIQFIHVSQIPAMKK